MIHHHCSICKNLVGWIHDNIIKTTNNYDYYVCETCHNKTSNPLSTNPHNTANFEYLKGWHWDWRPWKHYAKIDEKEYLKSYSYTRQRGTFGSFKVFYNPINNQKVGIKKQRDS